MVFEETPTYDFYDDDNKNYMMLEPSDEKKGVTSENEVQEQYPDPGADYGVYLNVSIMIPQGDLTGSRQNCTLKSHTSLAWHMRQPNPGYCHYFLLY